ncbi:MAG: AsmA-like C-terminal region-containing protein, partial [Desulfobacterales bacterium]
MIVRNRITVWLLTIAVFLMTLFLLSALLAPQLIKMGTVKELIEKKFSQYTAGTIAYQQLDLAYFPRPRVIARGVRFSSPTGVSGDMPALHIYPKLLPLIWGNFRVARLIAEKPEYTIRINETLSDVSRDKDDFTFSGSLRKVHDLILSLPKFILSGVNMRFKDGSLNLLKGEQRIFGFHDIQAFYTRPANKTKFNLTCKSNLWHSITLNGWMDATAFKSQGTIRLAEFRPQALSDYFFPDSALKMTEAMGNMIIDFETHGPDWLEANIEGSVPHLKLTQGNHTLILKDNTIKGGLQINKNTATVSLKELGLLSPRLNVSGELIIDQNQSSVSLEMQGQKFDVDSIRKLALEIGGNIGIINDIFTIIKGGNIPLITLSSQGHRIADLMDQKNMIIRGQMLEGKIFIPEVDLDLNQVEGKAVISNGILQGQNLKAQMGESVGQAGKLELGLNSDIDPFHLDIMVQADLSQLPAVLHRVVGDKDFLNELSLIDDVDGTASGKLVLDIDPRQENVKIEVSEAHLQARYQRIPYPIKIDGGHFFLDGLRLRINNFDVAIGESLFSNLSSTLNWEKATRLKLAAETVKLEMKEFYPWLVSLDTIQGELRNISEAEGIVRFMDINLEGPLFEPRNWQVKSRGEFDNLRIGAARLPDRIQIIGGQFDCQETQIHVKNVNASIGKSSFSHVEAKFDWGKHPTMMIQAGPVKIQADALYSWLLAFDALKPGLKEFQPIHGALVFNTLLMKGDLSGPHSRDLTLVGKLSKSVLNWKRFPDSIRIDSGQFSWQDTRMRFSKFNIGFGKSTFQQLSSTLIWDKANTIEAKLESATVFLNEVWPWLSSFDGLRDKISDFRTPQGMVTLNDIELSGPLNRPGDWRLFSTGDMKDIVIQSAFLDEPITLTHGKFILTQRDYAGAPHNCIKLGTTHLKWEESKIRLIGDIFFSPKTFAVDMNISLNSIDWGRIDKIIEYAYQKDNGDVEDAGESNIHLNLAIKSEKFTYNDYVFQPIQADVSLTPQEMLVAVQHAKLCEIALSGMVKATYQGLEFYVVPNSSNKNLESALSCLSNQKASASGKFDLEGKITAKAKPESPARYYSGELDFSADHGRIYRFGILAKILAILNVTEIYRGQIPDLVGEGFAYNSMNIKANFKGKKLVMEECSLDGTSMGLACEGDIDLADNTIDLVVLVAPFK